MNKAENFTFNCCGMFSQVGLTFNLISIENQSAKPWLVILFFPLPWLVITKSLGPIHVCISFWIQSNWNYHKSLEMLTTSTVIGWKIIISECVYLYNLLAILFTPENWNSCRIRNCFLPTPTRLLFSFIVSVVEGQWKPIFPINTNKYKTFLKRSVTWYIFKILACQSV